MNRFNSSFMYMFQPVFCLSYVSITVKEKDFPTENRSPLRRSRKQQIAYSSFTTGTFFNITI